VASPAAPAAAAGPAGPPPAPVRYAVRLAANGSTGIEGTAAGTGGSLDAELFLGSAPSLRAGLAVRTGDVPGLSGGDLTTVVRAGFTLWPVAPSAGGGVTVGVRVDGLALHHDLSHHADDGAMTRQGRWLPGMDVLVELGVRIDRAVYLVGAAGGEIAFGATDVLVDNRTVASIPALRGVAELGLRFLF